MIIFKIVLDGSVGLIQREPTSHLIQFIWLIEMHSKFD